jgi:vacuolar-type H+-ATPase subunit C/Vma6
MCYSKPSTKESFWSRAFKRWFQRKETVPPELQQALKDCCTLQELIDLLFSTDYTMDEAMIAAFDQRIDELEQGTTTNVYHEFNIYLQTKKHGNRTV